MNIPHEATFSLVTPSRSDRLPGRTTKEIKLRCKASGFTLVEILVVLVIVGILTALIIPAISGIKDRMDASKCVSNQRQIYQSLMMFAQDNSGRFPPARGTQQEDGAIAYKAWYTQLKNYGMEGWGPNGDYRNKAFYCPVSGRDGSGPFSDSNPDYGLNLLVATDQDASGGGLRSLATLRKLSGLVLLADTGDRNNPRAGDFRLLASQLISGGVPASPSDFSRPFGYPAFRHPPPPVNGDMTGGACNMLFCDGHVESVKWNDPRLQNSESLEKMFDPSAQ